jgi:hypothetical protein
MQSATIRQFKAFEVVHLQLNKDQNLKPDLYAPTAQIHLKTKCGCERPLLLGILGRSTSEPDAHRLCVSLAAAADVVF